jgi:hypothetical protein
VCHQQYQVVGLVISKGKLAYASESEYLSILVSAISKSARRHSQGIFLGALSVGG